MSVHLYWASELSCEYHLSKQQSVSDFWAFCRRTHPILEPFTAPSDFFARFLLLVNGVRLYELTTVVEPDDQVLLIASNKLHYPVAAATLPSGRTKCSVCNLGPTVYIAVAPTFSESERFCTSCFTTRIQCTAIKNISHYPLPRDCVVDLGLSGERDSTIALHFLRLFRERTGARFRINAVFNEIGLDSYDDSRRAAVKAAPLQREFGDQLVINSLKLPLSAACTARTEKCERTQFSPCTACGEGNIYRPFGYYFDDAVVRASGGPTVEDKIMATLVSPLASLPQFRVDSGVPTFRNRRWLSILEGLTEDELSIYAALLQLPYCVADCPLADYAETYKCRRHVLANYKALMPAFRTLAAEVSVSTSATLWGQPSSDRRLNYPTDTFWCSDCRQFHSLGNMTLGAVTKRADPGECACALDPTPAPSMISQRLASVQAIGEGRWLRTQVSPEAADALGTSNIALRLSPTVRLAFRPCMCLAHDTWADNITAIPMDARTQVLLKMLTRSRYRRLKTLLRGLSRPRRLEALRAIQRWIVLDLVECRVPRSQRETQTRRAPIWVFLYDDVGLFAPSDLPLMRSCILDSAAAKVVRIRRPDDHLPPGRPAGPAVRVLVSLDTRTFRRHHQRAEMVGYRGDSVYVYPGVPSTVGFGCYTCLEGRTESIFSGYRADRTRASRFRILAALQEFYTTDECTRLSGWSGKSMLYYMNPRTGKRVKELRICQCSRNAI